MSLLKSSATESRRWRAVSATPSLSPLLRVIGAAIAYRHLDYHGVLCTLRCRIWSPSRNFKMSSRDWDLTCKVYIGNLANHTSRHDIESAFSKYGNLRNVWVARNPPGFAFVEFDDSRDAEDAVRALDGSRHSCFSSELQSERRVVPRVLAREHKSHKISSSLIRDQPLLSVSAHALSVPCAPET
ncbi:hypothetical protein BIW11_06952 [Tropilaelaps mercedesae]|uniref:RRM domain-containing protein n=1 Tax=Tropilaelaps mercedesae TaxID=418985 RepID=A0A1V9XW20_9ACAR|nr:hypothetical protein BIW11_06952 [Tropilaelaps mercedesae]